MQTVIRVFENRRLAQTALDRLLQAGFQRENVHLQEGAAQANTALTADPRALTSAETGPERGLLSSVGRFFASLVGEDPPHGYVDRYSAAIWHGHPVIVVEANASARYQLDFPNNHTRWCKELQTELTQRFGAGAWQVE